MNISKAKQLFVHYYGDEDGFVGVGVGNATGKTVLKVYVDKEDSVLAKRLEIQRSFDGYPPVSYTHLTLPTTPYV